MKDVGLEIGTPWNRAQTEERLLELQDRLVDHTQILDRFTPHHAHLIGVSMLWPLRPLYERFPDADWIWGLNVYLKTRGLPGRFSGPSYISKEGSKWPIRKALELRELDFAVNYTTRHRIRRIPGPRFYINTSRVEGSRSIYQVFSNILPAHLHSHYDYSDDYLVYERGQQLITAMLAARV